mmetsp:Transcript_17190/g.26596  ORF Transcript_17190/g.26596 Transcript_17190/m.26596 type:complete len:80 (+) Transcript_17190:1927-2166(+)
MRELLLIEPHQRQRLQERLNRPHPRRHSHRQESLPKECRPPRLSCRDGELGHNARRRWSVEPTPQDPSPVRMLHSQASW